MADDGVIGGMSRGEPLYVENKLKIEWHDAPERTSWGGGMMQATIELDKDNTLDLYCDKDALHLVDSALRKLVENAKQCVGFRPAEPQREPTILVDAVDNGDRALWCVLAAAVIRGMTDASLTARVEKTVLVADALLAKAPKQ